MNNINSIPVKTDIWLRVWSTQAFYGTLLHILLVFIVCSFSMMIFSIIPASAQHYVTPELGGPVFFSVIVPDQIDTLDSQLAFDSSSLFIIRNIQEGLYEINLQGEPVPVLAADYPIKVSPLNYIIPLRKGVIFHDDTILQASDIVFTFNRLMLSSSETLTKNLFGNILSITEKNRFTIKITLKREIPNLVELFTRYELYPLSQNTVEKHPDSYGLITAVGTGPFRFKEWFKGVRIVLSKHNNYWMNRLYPVSGQIKIIESV